MSDETTDRGRGDDTAAKATQVGDPAGATVFEHTEDAPPTRLGRYRLVRKIGEGGMSVVFEAEYASRGRREALKVLRPEYGADPQLAERFHREVRAMAALSHDHVVTVFDSGESAGRLYYTMPLLPGPVLSQLLDEIRATGEKPPGRRALAVLDRYGIAPSGVPDEAPEVAYARRVSAALVGVADALAAMHGVDVLHRDLKPSNLMLDEKARLLVTDFGLARTRDQRITQTDQALGTPAYMSPEQIVRREQPLDGRTDVYSLGATLYELLTLELPHQGATVAETLQCILSRRARRIRGLNPAMPPAIETLVARCLETRVADRYSDAGRLRDDLEAFARGGDIRMRPVPVLKRLAVTTGRHWRPLAAIALVAAAAWGWYVTRPAYLTVRTIPPGTLYLDGEEVGTTPVVERRLSASSHQMRVVADDRFVPLEDRITLARGHTRDIERVLRAWDPADPDVIRLIASAHGLEPSTYVRTKLRAAPGAPRLVPLWPRGSVRAVPAALVLWADPGVGPHRVALSAQDGEARALETWEVPGGIDIVRLPLTEAKRALLGRGAAYDVRVREEGGRVRARVSFLVVTPEEDAELTGALARATHGFASGDPSALFVAAEVLIRHEAYAEAYDIVGELAAQFRGRQEVARLALAVLEKAHLSHQGPWAEWQAAYDAADESPGEADGRDER